MLRLIAAVSMVLAACSADGVGLRNDIDAAAVAETDGLDPPKLGHGDAQIAGTGGSGSGGQSVSMVGTGGQQATDARPGAGGASADAWVAPVGTGGAAGTGGAMGSGGAMAIDGGSNRDVGNRDTWEDRDIPPDISGVDLRLAVLPKCDSPDWPECALVRFPNVLCADPASYYSDIGIDGGRGLYASSCKAFCGRCTP